MSLKRIYKNHGFDGLILRLLKTLGFKIKYLDLIEKKKFNLSQRIKKISNQKIISGEYKDTYIQGNSEWNYNDISSKLLGVYEKQIQSLISQTQKKYKLDYIINFGASDGYHIIGNVKNNNFKKGYAFENNKKEIVNLKKNIELNNLNDKIEIFGEANFKEVLEIFNKEMLNKALFLIDIEGAEFKLFYDHFSNELKNSFFIVENHSFLLGDEKEYENFKSFLEDNFIVQLIKNSERNPFQFDFLKDISDDERWLLMSEQRPIEMNWLFLKPKNSEQ